MYEIDDESDDEDAEISEDDPVDNARSYNRANLKAGNVAQRNNLGS